MKFKFYVTPLLIFFAACAGNSPKEEKKNSSESTQIQQKASAKEEKKQEENKPSETLNTENVIPFLFEYEKKHKERYVRIITDYGNIDIELFNETPYHRANFIFLTKQQYFDGSVFHRVVKDFVIQGGNSDGWDIRRKRQKIGYYLLPPDTKKGFKHHRGIVSMPSSDVDNPHQFASPYEFFIVVQSPGAYHLDGNYTAFGRVIAGIEVVDKINQVETNEKSEWPKKDVKMKVILLDK